MRVCEVGFNPRELCPVIAAVDRAKGCEIDVTVRVQEEVCPKISAVAEACSGKRVSVPQEATGWFGWDVLGNVGWDAGFGPATIQKEYCPIINYVESLCTSKEGLGVNPKELCTQLKPAFAPHWASLTQVYGTFCHAPRVLHVSAGEWSGFSYDQWSMVYNVLSFGIASMGSATIFFWLMVSNVAKPFKPALAITGIVTLIATCGGGW